MAAYGALGTLDAIGTGLAAGPGGAASPALLLEYYDDDFVGFGAPYTGGAAAAVADDPCPDGYYDDFVASLRAQLSAAPGAAGGALALDLAPGYLEAEAGWPADDGSWGSGSGEDAADSGEDAAGSGEDAAGSGWGGAYDERDEYNGYGADGAYDPDDGADAAAARGDGDLWSGGACPCAEGIAGAIVPVGAADDAFAEFVLLGADGDGGDDGGALGGGTAGGDTGCDEPDASDTDDAPDASSDADDAPGAGSILAFVVARPPRA